MIQKKAYTNIAFASKRNLWKNKIIIKMEHAYLVLDVFYLIYYDAYNEVTDMYALARGDV